MAETAEKLVQTLEPAALVKNEPIKKVSIVFSQGALTSAYAGLILANAARMSGIDACMFFTFFGLDVVNKKKLDNLMVPTVGNPSMGIPTFLGSLPGMSWFATKMMKKQIDKMDFPPVREMLETLDDAGAELYGCRMSADMMGLTKDDFIPQVRDIISAMDFYDKSAGASIIFI